MIRFDDGIVTFYDLENTAVRGMKPVAKAVNPRMACYHEDVVGINRYYQARSVDVEISRVISCWDEPDLVDPQIAVIDGAQYRIEQIQSLYENGLRIRRYALSRTRGITYASDS